MKYSELKNNGRSYIKYVTILFMMIFLLSLTGCVEDDEENKVTTDPNASSLILKVDVELEDGHRVQIPEFKSTEKSNELDGINDDIKTLLLSMYERDMELDDRLPDIRTIIDESDEYLQAVVMYVEYPLLGSYGDVVSYNYVRAEDRRLTLSDALLMAGTTLDDLKNEIIEVYYTVNQETSDEVSIYGITADGFIINEDSSIDFYGNIDISVNASDPWSYIFCYNNVSGELMLLNPPHR